ncbi:uncharacterized protein N7458_009973 [Penicillium daleae]|uniref:Uncharacterized protein n=1 Tax=Penicillium daleae TaxID=63821 RepID=A0AAD6BYW9_9EURO|nr:uncharacterized protein N7458_009973 [Penicillium daleae]KAJ5438975.1 hypothetical protein N7458_009973 [Penicillium daleae]
MFCVVVIQSFGKLKVLEYLNWLFPGAKAIHEQIAFIHLAVQKQSPILYSPPWSKILEDFFNKTACWPNGKALDYESKDCRFDPCVGHVVVYRHHDDQFLLDPVPAWRGRLI